MTDPPPGSFAVGCFLLVLGLPFAAGAAYMGYTAVSEERAAALSMSEDGRPITDADEKQSVARMATFALGGGALFFLSASYGAFRGVSNKTAAVMKGMPDIPISPTRAAGLCRRVIDKMFGLPSLYLSPEMARTSINGCAVPLGILAALLAASWFWWRMPVIAYAFAGLVMLILAGVVLVPAARTLLAMKKLDIEVLAWTREVHAGDDVDMTVKVTARAPLEIRAIEMALIGVDQFKGSKSTSRDYLHTEKKALAKDLKVGAGWSQQFQGGLKVPEGAQPSDDEGRGRVCWIVGMTADVPGWPDLEVAREVKVVS